jgi:diguanylate cyclase (GGDEF)-like protein
MKMADNMPDSLFSPGCPLGGTDCPLCAEVQRLQAEVERLQELSHTDPLTGLYNFRYLLIALDQEMERTRRTGLPTSLIMVDLDHFKRINDTFGHPGGDEALRWVSKIWQDNLRRIDILCRYGGEEFAIILPGTRLPTAVRAARRLQATLEKSPLKLQGQEVMLTASFGVETYTGRESLSVKAFIKKADRFLLGAKQNGRNRVFFEEEEAQPRESTEITMDERAALGVGARPDQPARKRKKSAGRGGNP